MLENLTALAVAKVKAVGLVAGTAMVTTALVGGGAVAVTVVSNEKAQEVTSEEIVLDAELGEQRSDTATAAIEKDRGKPGDDEEQGTEGEGCGAEVSAVAGAKAEGTSGRDHGALVSKTARECNGSLDEDEDAGEAPGESAGKGTSDEAGKPATTGKPDTAGRPETGPGSAGSTGRPQSGPGAATTEDEEQETVEAEETEEAGSGRPAEAGRSAGKGGGRG